MAGFLTAAAGSSALGTIVSSVVRIAIAYGISRLINSSTQKKNNFGQPTARIDEGVRVQFAPSTTNEIPVLFGSAFYGGIITDAKLTDQNKTLWTCITLSDVVGQKISGDPVTTRFTNIYWNNQRVVFKADGITVDYLVNDDGVVDASPRDLVKIYLFSNGSATPAQLTDPETNNPIHASFTGVDARTLMPGWTNDHKMSNLTFALIRMTYNRDKGVTGLPDVKFNVRNDNYRPGDAIYAYLKNNRVGCNLPDSQIDIDSLNALNDYADDEITYLDDDGIFKTLGDRYQINGLINTKDPVFSNLEKLAAASGCYLNYDIAAGKWGVIINRDAAPTLHFNDSNIISGINVTGTALDSIYNGIEVEFPHRQIRDQSDYERIDLPDEYRNANEPDNTIRVKYDMLNEPLQARELGYIELYQNRMDQIVTFTTDYSKINTEAGDIITITNSIYDWNQKQFRVIRVKEVESDQGGIAVEITAQEYDATMYTAGGTPRRPGVPSDPIGIPSLGAIATPAAPSILETNNQNALPNIILRSVVPGSTQVGTSVIVDRMEFWFAEGTIADNIPIANYKLIEVSTNANGNPFTTGSNQDSQPIVTLAAGNYVFRVRAGNQQFFSEYSEPTALVWAPRQVTDEVNEAVTFRPKDPSLLTLLGPLALGAVAYFAYQALKPEILGALSNTELGQLLGIENPAEVEAAKEAMQQQAAGFRTIIAEGTTLESTTSNTVTFIAGEGISITASAAGNTITISTTPQPEPGEATINANFDEGTDFVMDNCRINVARPPRLRRAPGTYNLPRPVVIGGSTEAVDCYTGSAPVLEVVRMTETLQDAEPFGEGYEDNFINGNPPRPLPGGNFILNSPNPAVNGRTINYRVLDNTRIIAYCNFDDNGDALPVDTQCDEDPNARGTFSTVEFPAGNRFVTYNMIQNWITPVAGQGYPLSSQGTEVVTQNEFYSTNYVTTRYARICRDCYGQDASVDYNT